MTVSERDAFENAMIADMRAHDGAVTAGPMTGQPLLVLTATGARSGQARRSILTYTRDGGDYIVAGTAGGAPTDPAWVANLRATPVVSVEVAGMTVPATATVLDDGPERDRLWEQHEAALPWFAEYPAKTGRLIPMVRLTPTT